MHDEHWHASIRQQILGLLLCRFPMPHSSNAVSCCFSVHFRCFLAVEEAGGQCLPCEVNIRDEKAVEAAVHQAVQKFGGIDILVNNASAISLTGTLETPMKKYASSSPSFC